MAFNFTLLLLLLVPLVHASNSISQSFVKCLLYNTSFPHSVITARTNPSFQTVFHYCIRNERVVTSKTPKPQLIISPTSDWHVSNIVLCAKSTGFLLVIHNLGSDYEGYSYVPPIHEVHYGILDLSNFNSIHIHIPSESAWVHTAATLGELYYQIWKKSPPSVHYAFPGGICPTVGCGGHFGGGGYGNMIRKYGLSVDHLIDAVAVTADGRILNRKGMGEDLFWSLRGGGPASFAVVLKYRIRLISVPEKVSVFRIERNLDQGATSLVYEYLRMASKTVDELFIRMLIQPITVEKLKTIRVTFIAQYLGNADSLIAVMEKDFPNLRLAKEDCTETSWIRSTLFWNTFQLNSPIENLLNRTPDGVSFLKRKSDYLEVALSIDHLNKLWKQMIQGKTGLVINPYGGKMDTISSTSTPFPHRVGNLAKIQYSVNWDEKDGGASSTGKFLKEVRDLYNFTESWVSKNPRRAFLNYRDSDIGSTVNGEPTFKEGEEYGRKYFAGNYERLVKVKNMFDPNNVFRNAQSIPSTVQTSGVRRR